MLSRGGGHMRHLELRKMIERRGWQAREGVQLGAPLLFQGQRIPDAVHLNITFDSRVRIGVRHLYQLSESRKYGLGGTLSFEAEV